MILIIKKKKKGIPGEGKRIGGTRIFQPRFCQSHNTALDSNMPSLFLVLLITSDRWCRCLWFFFLKDACSARWLWVPHNTTFYPWLPIICAVWVAGHKKFHSARRIQWRHLVVHTWGNAAVRWPSQMPPLVALSSFLRDSLHLASFWVLASCDWTSHLYMTACRSKKEEFLWTLFQKNEEWQTWDPHSHPHERPLIGSPIGPQWVMCPFLNQ